MTLGDDNEPVQVHQLHHTHQLVGMLTVGEVVHGLGWGYMGTQYFVFSFAVHLKLL